SVKPVSNAIALCRLDELEDPGSKGFEVRGQRLFAVRQGQQVYVYRNSCPHRGIPLEWVPDQFLDRSGRLIQCASHGALFLPKSGERVACPCRGASLTPIPWPPADAQLWLAPVPQG